MKTQTEIVWWFPGKLRLAYSGAPASRWKWIRMTWRGYFAMWCLLFHAARILRKPVQLPRL